jgi:thiol-disulfide isomerase/thioredoxin
MTPVRWCFSRALALSFATILGVAASEVRAQTPAATGAGARPDEQVDEGARAAKWLRASFEGQPTTEAAEMFIAIAGGSPMGPGKGWFHPGQSRFGWSWLAQRHGLAGGEALTPSRFRGPAEFFARLDRDKDGVLKPEDFSWSDRPMPAPKPGTRMVYPGMPTEETLVRGLFRGEIGSLQEGPRLNDPAPDFTLRSRDGNSSVRLSDHFGKRPIVLVFGNFTCGPFRSTYPAVQELARRYRSEALFLAVYVREAHPTDGWRMDSNDKAGVTIAQPRDYTERVAVANVCGTKLKMEMPLLVDEIDDRVGNTYSGMPSRLYLIDREGKVAYKSGRGPFGFKPGELEQSLVMLLLAQQDKENGTTNPVTGAAGK